MFTFRRKQEYIRIRRRAGKIEGIEWPVAGHLPVTHVTYYRAGISVILQVFEYAEREEKKRERGE